MTSDLRDKTALVTGSARRIGKAIALKLGSAGARIAFTYRTSVREAEATVEEIRALGVEAHALKADLSRLADCEELVRAATRALGRIDILVNNASQFPRTNLEELARDPQAFEAALDAQVHLHLRAPLFLGARLGFDMKKRGWGRIVNITDRVTEKAQAYPGWAFYLVTKYALKGVSQVLAEELRPEVTVNSVAPGLVLPPEYFSEEEVREALSHVPLRRAASPEEIAEDVLHLVRSESKTGSAILTDGGAGVHTE
jgi:NAD(P)-dependent dehydrogenase (short-subunit alcohol dehydrogenase family)